MGTHRSRPQSMAESRTSEVQRVSLHVTLNRDRHLYGPCDQHTMNFTWPRESSKQSPTCHHLKVYNVCLVCWTMWPRSFQTCRPSRNQSEERSPVHLWMGSFSEDQRKVICNPALVFFNMEAHHNYLWRIAVKSGSGSHARKLTSGLCIMCIDKCRN